MATPSNGVTVHRPGNWSGGGRLSALPPKLTASNEALAEQFHTAVTLNIVEKASIPDQIWTNAGPLKNEKMEGHAPHSSENQSLLSRSATRMLPLVHASPARTTSGWRVVAAPLDSMGQPAAW